MILLLLPLLAASLQDEAPPAPQGFPPGFKRTTWTLLTDNSHHFAGEIESSDAEVEITQYKLSLGALHLFDMKNVLDASAAGEFIEYRFDNLNTVLPGAPRDFEAEVHAWRSDATFLHSFDAHWSGALFGTVSSAYDEGADVGDSVAGAVGIGVLHRFDQDLTLGLAIRSQFRIEEDPYVWPLPYVEWRISPRAELPTEIKAGYGLTFTYALDEPQTWSLDARMRFKQYRFRLDDRSLVPDGIIEDLRFILDAGVRWKPTPDLKLGLYLGVDVWQKFELSDKRGSTIEEARTEPQAVVGLDVSGSF